MSQTISERLEYLRQANSNRQWKNDDLYRLLYRVDLYILAYERIKSKPGNMTPGTDGETLDGFSIQTILTIIEEMRTEHFRFKPVRTTFIPKANGKMRKLGIPCVIDKVVQEAMRLILEAIYDSPYGPYFRGTSHGCRPNHSCHTALREFREQWSAVNWLIEGDIHACFDELNHLVLVTTLRKKIHDERFLNLIWKLLNAGYMDLHGREKESLIGSPQGGILSPILANAYLHGLDEFVEGLQAKLEKGKRKQRNPAYQRLSHQKSRMVKRGETKTKEFQRISQLMRTMPTLQLDDPGFIRIKYLRYADDWIVGIWGNRALAEQIKQEIKTFLHDQLRLTLSEEKTHITHARTEEALFLGTRLKVGTGAEAKLTLQTNRWGKKFKRRSTGWETVMKAPLPKLLKRLSDRGFCTTEGKPIAKSGWAFLDTEQIILLYSSVNRGIQNYYRFVDNWSHLQRIQYILHFSLAMTLGRKFNISTPKVFKRFGKRLTYVIKDKGGQEKKTVSFSLNHDWAKNRDAFQSSRHPGIDLIRSEMHMRSRSSIAKPCCICGDTMDKAQIEMHHVRHLRKLSDKRQATGFNRVLRMLNRKQIPVCKACHDSIHRGKHDSLKLSDMAYLPR
jgi:group II intron reverse transcriptase/maturase